MSSSKIAPLHTDLDFNSPLSDARVSRLIRTLQPLDGARVVEVGCGWAELLLRIAAAQPSAHAAGIDTDEAAIEHGRANAAARGLSDRVDLQVADALKWDAPAADVAICVGASHAWGGTAAALDALRLLVRPGGRVLLLANPDDPEAERVRAKADEHRKRWLRGYRGVLGFAYLTLARPAERHG
jgi:cyclopropane fatty-acyl-phospholipid synthase-like methyltransferase